MARPARHAAPHTPTAHRAMLRAGLALTAAGLAFGAAGTASAADGPPGAPAEPGGAQLPPVTRILTGAVQNAAAPLTDLQLDPLANTGSDPLDNAIGTQIGDFKPVSTAPVTDLLADGNSLSELPLVGPVTSGLLSPGAAGA